MAVFMIFYMVMMARMMMGHGMSLAQSLGAERVVVGLPSTCSHACRSSDGHSPGSLRGRLLPA
jgi:hypothetical protein